MSEFHKTTTPLETALVAAAFDPSSRPFFYRNLQGFEGYAASRKTPNPSSRVTLIRIPRSTQGRASQPHVAVYSSPEMVPKEFSPVKIKLGELFRAVRGTPVSLNPNQAATKDFSVDEIESILAGELSGNPEVVREPQWMPSHDMFSSPASPLAEHWGSLRDLLRDHPSVSEAWAAEFGTAPTLGLGVWLISDSKNNASLSEAATECRVMFATISDPSPPAVVSLGTPPPCAVKIYP